MSVSNARRKLKNTPFSGGVRHKKRIEKIAAYERKQ
jgi:ribose 5-phosphate isomerase RpiB